MDFELMLQFLLALSMLSKVDLFVALIFEVLYLGVIAAFCDLFP